MALWKVLAEMVVEGDNPQEARSTIMALLRQEVEWGDVESYELVGRPELVAES